MIKKANEKCEMKFRVNPPLFLPFYNVPLQNKYYTEKKFSYNPFTIKASSTSGSPVVITENKFFGFLNKCGGEFSFDGTTYLTVTLYEGQELYYNENCNPYEEWGKYSKLVRNGKEKVNESFWSNLEYCTWVEQTKHAKFSGLTNHDVINEKFVYDYMDKIEKMGLPKGKLTIDDGWAINRTANGEYLMGNWEINRNKFPNMEKLVEDIKERGFIPGLWLAPFASTPDSELAKQHPELLGTPYDVNRKWYNLICNEEILRPYYRKLFRKYADMGFMKFKLDISYGPKNEMIDILKIISEEIKSINPKIEIESHIPDIFASEYADTIRTNDVLIDREGKWRYVTAGRYNVCRNSSPDRIINLDHIGANDSLVSAKDFMEHFEMLKQYSKESGAYLVVSYLPDLFTEEIQEKFRNGLYELYNKDGSRKNGK